MMRMGVVADADIGAMVNIIPTDSSAMAVLEQRMPQATQLQQLAPIAESQLRRKGAADE